jgi:hypothetical protein
MVFLPFTLTSHNNEKSLQMNELFYSLVSLPTTIEHKISSAFGIHGLISDLLILSTFGFIILCQIKPKWVAKNQSVPYVFHPSWNFGTESFNLQVLLYELFHTSYSCRCVHAVTIFLEGFCWIYMIRCTFGFLGVLGLFVFSCTQALTYGDKPLGYTISAVNLTFTLLSEILWLSDDVHGTALNWVKIVVFWSVALRTLSHVAEPMPPTYDREMESFAEGFGDVGVSMVFSRPWHGVLMLVYGKISEMGSGLPGRLFGVLIYKIMWQFGYRSENLLGIEVAKRDGRRIVKMGWAGHPTTAQMFHWGIHKRTGDDKGASFADKAVRRRSM